jgi:hypothetical protein
MMLKTHWNCITSTLALDDLVEIRAQSAFAEAEEPEPIERIMRISKLTEGYGLVEVSISVSGIQLIGTITEQQQQQVDRKFGKFVLVLKEKKFSHRGGTVNSPEKKGYISRQTSWRCFIKSPAGTPASPPVMLDFEGDLGDSSGRSASSSKYHLFARLDILFISFFKCSCIFFVRVDFLEPQFAY